MPRAILATMENVDYIISVVAALGLNIDYLPDVIEDNAVNGVRTYVLVDGTVEENNVVCTDWREDDIRQLWNVSSVPVWTNVSRI